ncbi:MAG TPA: hypothetical protein VMM12_04615 [Longimicrobiales bacterium]|nr:hypothetical protein [Longimicrobiales bacterium]
MDRRLHPVGVLVVAVVAGISGGAFGRMVSDQPGTPIEEYMSIDSSRGSSERLLRLVWTVGSTSALGCQNWQPLMRRLLWHHGDELEIVAVVGERDSAAVRAFLRTERLGNVRIAGQPARYRDRSSRFHLLYRDSVVVSAGASRRGMAALEHVAKVVMNEDY